MLFSSIMFFCLPTNFEQDAFHPSSKVTQLYSNLLSNLCTIQQFYPLLVRSSKSVRSFFYIKFLHYFFLKKIPKRKYTFIEFLPSEFIFLRKFRKTSQAFCPVCKATMSMEHGSRSDIKQHAERKKHLSSRHFKKRRGNIIFHQSKAIRFY